jgi:peptidoglycan/xylan/chitin deacetylase (PgdA/CDA1 family)
MLKVFITVDTEVYPLLPGWRDSALAEDIARDIYGRTKEGDFGLVYQLDLLNSHGLNAVFFVEGLFASAVGLGPLRDIVGLIHNAGHEVQLHIHPEWLEHLPETAWGGRAGELIREFTEEEQTEMIALALRNLRDSGASDVVAFRAGDYAANSDTLRALAKNGISFDTSYNYCHLPGDYRTPSSEPLVRPTLLDGIWEFPISFFSDGPGHFRHAQLMACSHGELANAMLTAWRDNWYAFVIVSHSYELLMNRRRRLHRPRPDRILIRRFRRLCEFLDSHRDKFETATFSGIDPREIPTTGASRVITSSPMRTAGRFAEQGVRRAVSKILK